MNKRYWKLAVLSTLFVIGLICAICLYICSLRRVEQNTSLPNEVSSLIERYMEAYSKGTEESVQYMYFEDDFMCSAYKESGDRLIAYKIESTEKINDKLYALTV